MPAAIRTPVTLLLLFWLVLGSALAGEFPSNDDTLVLQSAEEFRKAFNPHAILSLQTDDGIVVVVTKVEERWSVTELYDGIPSTFEQGSECVGRVLLSVDSEDAPTFLVKGMFPPEEDSTHDTVFTVANHNGFEYTFMIHYPLDMKDEGFEWATGLLTQFRWVTSESEK